jgi:hypothetical protein
MRLQYSNKPREKTRATGEDLQRYRFALDDFVTPSPASTEARSAAHDFPNAEKTQDLGYSTHVLRQSSTALNIYFQS